MIFFWPLFRGLGRNPEKNFIGFLGDLKTPKGHFKINWPLVRNFHSTITQLIVQIADAIEKFGSNPKCDRDWINVLKTYWKRIETVLKTYWKHIENVLKKVNERNEKNKKKNKMFNRGQKVRKVSIFYYIKVGVLFHSVHLPFTFWLSARLVCNFRLEVTSGGNSLITLGNAKAINSQWQCLL